MATARLLGGGGLIREMGGALPPLGWLLRPLLLGAGLAVLLTQPAASSSSLSSQSQSSNPHFPYGAPALFTLSLSGMVPVVFSGADDGHVEMDGFLERLSARIDGREPDEPALQPPPPPPPRPPPPQPPQPRGDDGAGVAGLTAEAFAETLPVRLNKINPDLSQKTGGRTTLAAGVTERTINLVDGAGKEGRYKLRQNLPNGGYSIVTEEGKRVGLNELQLLEGSRKNRGGGGDTASAPPAEESTVYAGLGVAEQTRINQALSGLERRRDATVGGFDSDDDAASSKGGSGRKKRRSGGKDRAKANGGAPLDRPGSFMPASDKFIGSGGYPPRPVLPAGVAVQRYPSGPAQLHRVAPVSKAEKKSALDDEWRQFNTAPVAAHQWQDEGAKVYVLVQVSAVDIKRTIVDIRRDEVRVMTWNIVGQPVKCHLLLHGTVVPKNSYWEVGDRGGIDIALHKRDPDDSWPKLLRAEIDPIALGELPHGAAAAPVTVRLPHKRLPCDEPLILNHAVALHAGRIPVPRQCQLNNPISAAADWVRRQQENEWDHTCDMLLPEAVFYAEDSAAMQGVSTWFDELHSVSFPHRLSLTYPGSSSGDADGSSVTDGGGEAEIGKIFDADGGPDVAQNRVQSYLLGRGVNDTQSWGSWTQLGNTWRALAQPYRAVQCFRKALHLKGSDDPDVLLNLGLVVQHAGHPEDALVLIDRAVELAPRGMLYRYIRATLYDIIPGRERDALAEYEAVVKITPLFQPALERIKHHTIATLIEALPYPVSAMMEHLPWLGDLYWLLSGGQVGGHMHGFIQLDPPAGRAVPHYVDVPWPINVRLELRYSIETCVAIIGTSMLVFFYLKPFEAIFGAMDRVLDHLLGTDGGGVHDGGSGRGTRGKRRGGAPTGGGSAWASTSFGAVR